MSLAALFNVPSNEQELLEFSFHNQDQHDQLVKAIAAKKGVSLIRYSLDPLSTAEPENWFRQHQQAHSDFTSALGIAGVDLTDVDFKDEEQLASWIRLHGNEHLQAANMLGIG